MKKGSYNRQLIALKNLKKHLVEKQTALKECTDVDTKKVLKSNINRINSEIAILEKRTK